MKKLVLIIICSFVVISGFAQSEKKEFNAGEMIMEHIKDEHSWHILTYKGKDIAIPLPVILINNGRMDCFFSNRLSEGAIYRNYRLATTESDGENLNGKIISVDNNGNYISKPLDFSITKNVLTLFIVAGILIFIVLKASRMARRCEGREPKGLLTLIEYVVCFVRDDIAIPSIGQNRYSKFLPYLLSVFCFIFLSNIMGLFPTFPGGSNLTGNIAITLVLALITFFITNFQANRHYFKHIVNMEGVPWWLKFPLPIMPLVETLSVFTKPFALTIRLFANITAGHIIILSFLSLIFIFGHQSLAGGYGVSVVAVFFAVFMSLLEILVAFIQAYVFTLLSAIYIGMAHEEHITSKHK